jgi:tetratricopeptide (TPR) repeat protein
MNEPFEYIEDYFENRLGTAEKSRFEARCVEDEAFAAQVALYALQRKALRAALVQQKTAAWTEPAHPAVQERAHPATVRPLEPRYPTPPRRLKPRPWLAWAVAASLLLGAAGWWLFRGPASPHQLASAYIDKTYARLSQTMDGSTDSLQQGIAAYNRQEYDKALDLFEGLYKAHPERTDALRYEGIVYLRRKNYDKALETFSELAHTNGLLSNPGLFLQAVTLLRRDAPGDKERAKSMLNMVVQQQLDGAGEAATWLKRF